MSSRALRKLHGSLLPEIPTGGNDQDSSEDDMPQSSSIGSVANRFDMLETPDVDGINDNIDAQSDEGSELPAYKPVIHQIAGDKKQKNKKKKKLKKKEAKGLADEQQTSDLDGAIAERGMLDERLGMPTSLQDVTRPSKAVLGIQHRFLNPLNEMKKRFGSKVVQGDARQSRTGAHKHYRKPMYLSTPTDAWRSLGKPGLSMVPKEVVKNSQYFAFEHSTDYQKVQAMFWDAVDSLNPDNIVAILNLHPYHIDSLLQLSDVCRVSEDLQMAADLIERSLYVFENAFHPLFSLTTGSCRLDYRVWENRGFFIALFRHIGFISGRGCYRTALEYCKLLLSFDPENDPLCILLMVDFFAVQAGEYRFLLDLFEEWEGRRNLSKLPNFAYSVPLALFHLSSAEVDDSSSKRGSDSATRRRADSMLQSALMLFPSLLMPLLDKIGVNPGSDVDTEKLFGADVQLKQQPSLRQLVALYVNRCHACWKAPDVVQWLEENVSVVRATAAGGACEQLVRGTRIRDACFRGSAPLNVYRHIVMSEIKSVTVNLPPEFASIPVMSYDPLPPKDSVQSYEKTERRRRIDNQSFMSSFFHSLLPNFNAQEPAAEDAAAAAGGAAAVPNLREGVDALMNAMRNLLQNIQMAPPPREDREGNEGNDEDDAADWD